MDVWNLWGARGGPLMIQRRVQTVSGQGRRLPAPGAPPRRGLARSRFPEFQVCSPRSTSARAMRARPGAIHTNSIRASPSRAMSFSPGRPPDQRGDRVGSSAAPLPVCCAPSPSAAPLLLVQWRVKRRSRGKGAQRTRVRTGPRSSLCMGSSSHSPLRPHRPRPSRRGCERIGGRRRPRRASGTRNGALGGSFRPAPDCTIAKTAESCGNC